MALQTSLLRPDAATYQPLVARALFLQAVFRTNMVSLIILAGQYMVTSLLAVMICIEILFICALVFIGFKHQHMRSKSPLRCRFDTEAVSQHIPHYSVSDPYGSDIGRREPGSWGDRHRDHHHRLSVGVPGSVHLLRDVPDQLPDQEVPSQQVCVCDSCKTENPGCFP
eukprot:GABU01009011.1.p1 GENE.GABU01009011.1~~GABU01009011.1.p1  ORF type:complete len:168 (-),score=11.52 GABU01009011.1:73-576(-)